MKIGKPRKYETEKDYILKWANNAGVMQAIPDKKKRIAVVKQAFRDNFMPNQ